MSSLIPTDRIGLVRVAAQWSSCVGGLLMTLVCLGGCCGQRPDGHRANDPLSVLVTADRPESLYANGEKVIFTIDVMQGGKRASQGEVEVWLSQDGGPGRIEKRKFSLSAQSPIKVEGSVGEPAFYLCQAWASQALASVHPKGAYGEKMVWYRAPANPDETVIELSTDRADALYRSGEKAVFTASVTRGGRPLTDGRLALRLSREGEEASIAEETFDLAAGNAPAISGTLSEPGFLYCQASLSGSAGKGQLASAWTSVGFDVYKIAPASAAPADFEAFWKETLARARRLPVDVELRELAAFSNDKATYYRFSINTLNDERVYGFLGVPAGPGPFPAIIIYPGYGAGLGSPLDLGLTPRGAITLMMNVHKYPVAESPSEAQRQMQEYIARNKASSYVAVGETSRETQHFHTVLAGFCRAVDYICSRTDWDRTHLVVAGSSQGGFLTLATAGLCPERVTCAMAGVPYLCDFARGHRTANAATLNAMSYYDGANFARLIRCPVRVSVGFSDGSCPPATVFSAYNAIPGPDKSIRMGVSEGHDITPARQAMERDWILRGLGFMPWAGEEGR